MPEYIASGKHLRAEGSVKVTADSDQEAFLAAKKELPVVTKIERINPDGSLTEILGIPYDNPHTELVSDHAEKKTSDGTSKKWKTRHTVFLVCLLIGFFLEFVRTCGQYAANNANPTITPAPLRQN